MNHLKSLPFTKLQNKVTNFAATSFIV